MRPRPVRETEKMSGYNCAVSWHSSSAEELSVGSVTKGPERSTNQKREPPIYKDDDPDYKSSPEPESDSDTDDSIYSINVKEKAKLAFHRRKHSSRKRKNAESSVHQDFTCKLEPRTGTAKKNINKKRTRTTSLTTAATSRDKSNIFEKRCSSPMMMKSTFSGVGNVSNCDKPCESKNSVPELGSSRAAHGKAVAEASAAAVEQKREGTHARNNVTIIVLSSGEDTDDNDEGNNRIACSQSCKSGDGDDQSGKKGRGNVAALKEHRDLLPQTQLLKHQSSAAELQQKKQRKHTCKPARQDTTVSSSGEKTDGDDSGDSILNPPFQNSCGADKSRKGMGHSALNAKDDRSPTQLQIPQLSNFYNCTIHNMARRKDDNGNFGHGKSSRLESLDNATKGDNGWYLQTSSAARHQSNELEQRNISQQKKRESIYPRDIRSGKEGKNQARSFPKHQQHNGTCNKSIGTVNPNMIQRKYSASPSSIIDLCDDSSDDLASSKLCLSSSKDPHGKSPVSVPTSITVQKKMSRATRAAAATSFSSPENPPAMGRQATRSPFSSSSSARQEHSSRLLHSRPVSAESDSKPPAQCLSRQRTIHDCNDVLAAATKAPSSNLRTSSSKKKSGTAPSTSGSAPSPSSSDELRHCSTSYLKSRRIGTADRYHEAYAMQTSGEIPNTGSNKYVAAVATTATARTTNSPYQKCSLQRAYAYAFGATTARTPKSPPMTTNTFTSSPRKSPSVCLPRSSSTTSGAHSPCLSVASAASSSSIIRHAPATEEENKQMLQRTLKKSHRTLAEKDRERKSGTFAEEGSGSSSLDEFDQLGITHFTSPRIVTANCSDDETYNMQSSRQIHSADNNKNVAVAATAVKDSNILQLQATVSQTKRATVTNHPSSTCTLQGVRAFGVRTEVQPQPLSRLADTFTSSNSNSSSACLPRSPCTTSSTHSPVLPVASAAPKPAPFENAPTTEEEEKKMIQKALEESHRTAAENERERNNVTLTREEIEWMKPTDRGRMLNLEGFIRLFGTELKSYDEKYESLEKVERSRCVRAGNNGKNQKSKYGRVETMAMEKIRLAVNLQKHEKFIDVGSGMGTAVIQMACTVGCHSSGIEVDKGRNDLALGFKYHVHEWYIHQETRNNVNEIFHRGDITFFNDDFRKKEHSLSIVNADVVFVNNAAGIFAQDLDRGECSLEACSLDDFLCSLFACMKPGSRMVTFYEMFALGPSNEECKQLRNRELHWKQSKMKQGKKVLNDVEPPFLSFFEKKMIHLGKDAATHGFNQDVSIFCYTRIPTPNANSRDEKTARWRCNKCCLMSEVVSPNEDGLPSKLLDEKCFNCSFKRRTRRNG